MIHPFANVCFVGEVKNPGKTIPKTLISGTSTVAVLYILTNVSYLAVLSPQEIISSDFIAGIWIDRVCPFMQWVISLVISLSILNSTVCEILSASRVIYSASREGQLPFLFSMLNNHSCPVVAVTKIIILSSVVIIPSNLIKLIKYLMLASSLVEVLYTIALLKLRYREPHLHRPYKVNQNNGFTFLLALHE
ncbi:solute carrier family 7 member 13-like isoform X1 [Acomys russatus]|uniref:solute carrier family 7 member 13-like isoform X1 n=1 Tax=Acomys russatus TaxID=60746 RepID=UPI0021E324D2|nr:solute carrier family 7 member 13-like isoform X1 [Acomys russatus]